MQFRFEQPDIRRALRRAALVVAAPVAMVATGACFATRSDVVTLQSDVASVRAEVARADSARNQQLADVAASLRVANDSLRALSTRAARFQGDTREAMRGIAELLIQVQELTGQSQRRIQELRSDLEQRSTQPSATPDSAGGAAAAAAPSGAAPGPHQLYQLAQDQLRRGSWGAARAGFNDLLRRFPNADVAPDAQFYIAESFAGEGNAVAADTAYGAVVRKYPSSPRAATATYKRAQARAKENRTREATALYEEIVRRWPKSDEAVLAREALRAPR